ncbi:uncharacterized protein GGS22DRAFT_1438 [Annulohypoxylon maeteangense]|uniref:uncharacterized protein n=1 Tax=Annulohypoxylon maeteangense TaxID=1927788 RepID=UPI0020084FB6|nr:uncharacterized protein GGS22DRAFT_1438 [Annulohypoxylon maeteangense]KAI0889578.1 hypothetical protein GGS22DRAFT_1438 [Annulohypoxylon maeteangense]
MEHKASHSKDEKRQVPESQDGKNTTSHADNTPPTSQQPASVDHASKDTRHIPLNRPWKDRRCTIEDTLKREQWWKAELDKGDPLERWYAQSISDGPYHNMKSVVTETQARQPNAHGDQLPRKVAPISETAATSGSG